MECSWLDQPFSMSNDLAVVVGADDAHQPGVCELIQWNAVINSSPYTWL